MKRLMMALVAGAGALVVWRKLHADQAEQDLWAEATDRVA